MLIRVATDKTKSEAELEVERAGWVQCLRLLRNDRYTAATTKEPKEFVLLPAPVPTPLAAAAENKSAHDGDDTVAATRKAWEAVLQHAHAVFERDRQQQARALVEQQRCMEVARRTAATGSLWAFAGRVSHYAGTRGGNYWPHIVACLTDPNPTAAKRIPDRMAKVEILFTGELAESTGKTYPIISGGNVWIATAADVDKFTAALGHDAMMKLELKLRGRVCTWVYRASDKPNRHGYHNSHPNPRFGGYSFPGFDHSKSRQM